ncbi:MAG: mechanosensitive ion channel family protein [Acidimicrobiales bacterium]
MLISAAGSTSSDRGIIHQLLIDLGVSPAQAHTAQVYAIGPLRILLVLVLAFVLSRLVKGLSGRLVRSLRLISPLVRATPRGEDRARTLAGVFTSVFRLVIWVVALLTILGELRIDLTPFVATATVIGAAVGFGAQSLIKDFLSGVLILAEDQYGVGDSIVVGSGANATSGTVESVNLRTTRIRGLDGVVWYVPNGDIRTVGNNTESDSQAVVDVVVPLGTDLDAASAVAESAARSLATEPAWKGVFVGEPVFAGVQSTDLDSATLRLTAWTRPGQHFRASRALRMRIVERLREEGMAWGAAGAPAPAGTAAGAAAPAGTAAAAPPSAAAPASPEPPASPRGQS